MLQINGVASAAPAPPSSRALVPPTSAQLPVGVLPTAPLALPRVAAASRAALGPSLAVWPALRGAGNVAAAGANGAGRAAALGSAFRPQGGNSAVDLPCAAILAAAVAMGAAAGRALVQGRLASRGRVGHGSAVARCAKRVSGAGDGNVDVVAQPLAQPTGQNPEEIVSFGEVDLRAAFAERAAQSVLTVGKEHKAPVTKWNDNEWNYFDIAKIYVQGGDGGHGCKSFHREKCMPNMGPDGGNGGHGGHVFLRCAFGKTSFSGLKQSLHYSAQRGTDGEGDDCHGKCGKHRYIDVPPGTCVYVKDAWKSGGPKGYQPGRDEMLTLEDVGKNFVGELTKPGELLRVARGGLGGRGNAAFKTHSDTAPWVSEDGEKGVCRWIDLELKILSDVGIIGCPNAGKSSLLSSVTKKFAKVAPYPFSTIEPNVGFYKADEHGGLNLVDVPGIIEGAHVGRGMGIKFLRHIERCRTLIHVVAADSEDPLGDFDVIQRELREYSTEVAAKPQVVVVNKVDIMDVRETLPELMAALRKRCGHTRVFDVSVATRHHVDTLMKRVCKWHRSIVKDDIASMRGVDPDEAALVLNANILTQLGGASPEVKNQERVELDRRLAKRSRVQGSQFEPKVEWDVLEECWRLKHPELEQLARRTNWRFQHALDRINGAMKSSGMSDKLIAMGVKDGEYVIIDKHKFMYSPGRIGEDSRMLQYSMSVEYGEWEFTNASPFSSADGGAG